MAPDPEMIERVREAGRRRRRLTAIEEARHELAPIVDTGCLSDEDVMVLWANYAAARDGNGGPARV